MSLTFTRRAFMGTAAAFGAAQLLLPATARAQQTGRVLVAGRRQIEVAGKAAAVFGLHDKASGKPGIVLEPGERFALALENESGEPTIVHWHGQTPPPDQDGVSDTQYVPPLEPGEIRAYDFEPRPGTHWMHSHHGLQEQLLLAAPLIVQTKEDAAADLQEHVVFLHDFTFRDPAEILAELTGGSGGMDHGAMGHGGMDMSSGGMDMAGAMDMGSGGMDMAGSMAAMGAMDLNDVAYDAFLANDRTLDDPEVVAVEAGGKVRLRVINAATATAFWLDFGGASGTIVAVDGNPVAPLADTRFPIAQGQRLDIVVTVPAGTAVPVLAQREGDTARTGLFLAAPGAAIGIIGPAAEPAPPVDNSLELRLAALLPLSARDADRTLAVMLAGTMSPYVWTMNNRLWADRIPMAVAEGERVEIEITNHSMMAHPMHLHGHHFQVVAINGKRFAGAVRDTVLVRPMQTVTVAFEPDNPGRWLFHCHNLYHMATGMMGEVVYAG